MEQDVDLRELIIATYGADAAEAWAKCSLGDADREKLVEAGRRTLDLFPGRMPHACALMSAVYFVALEKLEAPHAYVVAGSLYVGNTRVFGEDGDINWKSRFATSNLDWDGHAWIVCGDWLADASILRTAASKGSAPALSRYVEETERADLGLMACKLNVLERTGLRYLPQYVLPQDQVDALVRGAWKVVAETGSG
jgi:hypothetical protein